MINIQNGTLPSVRQLSFFTAAVGKLLSTGGVSPIVSFTLSELLAIVGESNDTRISVCLQEMTLLCIKYFNYKRKNRDKGIYVFNNLWQGEAKTGEMRVFASFTKSALTYFSDTSVEYYKCRLTQSSEKGKAHYAC